MAARRLPAIPESAHEAAALSRPTGPLSATTEISYSRARVVSVSPHMAAVASSMELSSAPPVNSLGDSGAVDQIRQLATRLERLIEQGRTQDVQSTKASLQLQERLRLSARMLRAFQAQIDRVEASLKSQQDQERRLQQLQAQIEQQCTAAQGMVEHAVKQSQSLLELLNRVPPPHHSTVDGDDASKSIELSVDAPLKFRRFASRTQG